MCVHSSAAAGTRHYACRWRSPKPGLTSQKRLRRRTSLTGPPGGLALSLRPLEDRSEALRVPQHVVGTRVQSATDLVRARPSRHIRSPSTLEESGAMIKIPDYFRPACQSGRGNSRRACAPGSSWVAPERSWDAYSTSPVVRSTRPPTHDHRHPWPAARPAGSSARCPDRTGAMLRPSVGRHRRAARTVARRRSAGRRPRPRPCRRRRRSCRT